ncbi:MAG: hypothetical protein B7L53_08030 [Thermofilum sp. NZ13]|nr:MAG: hypothetical protein B7L53_08030 [Thermofilum sp. NZ13]
MLVGATDYHAAPAEKERLRREAGERGWASRSTCAQAPRLKATKPFSLPLFLFWLLLYECPRSAVRPLEFFTATVAASPSPRSNTNQQPLTIPSGGGGSAGRTREESREELKIPLFRMMGCRGSFPRVMFK